MMNVQKGWAKYHDAILRASIMLMVAVAIGWLGYQLWRLILFDGYMGAVDLKQRHEEIHRWVEHKNIYESGIATYPPASYVMLWPLFGWMNIQPARWLWAVTSIGSLYWLICIILRESNALGGLERRFIALIPLATYGAGATIGNGQLTVHVMPVLLSGLLLLSKDCNWKNDLTAASLLLFAFVKPNVAIPFFWILLFVPGRVRPAFLLIIGYFTLTLFAALVNHTGPVSLIRSWIENGLTMASWASFQFDKASVHSLLYVFGHSELNSVASLLLLFGLGFWVFGNRHRNIWLLIGVTAIVTRFWTYHGWYDDLLILFPMVTLFRIARCRVKQCALSITAGILFALMLLSIIAPGGRYLFSHPWNIVYIFGQISVWLAVLVFLIVYALSITDIGKVDTVPPNVPPRQII